MKRAPEEASEPDQERIVQAELLAQDLDVLGRGAEVGHQHGGGIAGQGVHEREHGGRHPEQDEQGGGQSPGEKAGHEVLAGPPAGEPGNRACHPAPLLPAPAGLKGYFFSHISAKYAS